MFVCKCKYCPHVYDGGPNCIRVHILGIKGEGVAACLDPPDAIKEICKKLHVAKGKMSSQGIDVNDHVDANIEHVLDGQDVEKVSSQSPMLSHMDVDINAGPSMKKAKLSGDKNTLAKAWQMQAQKAATVAVHRFFYAEDVPHWKALRTRKADAVAEIVYGPSFWQEARTIVNICVPILKVLRLANREGATMGLIYEFIDRMVEKIEYRVVANYNSSKSDAVKQAAILQSSRQVRRRFGQVAYVRPQDASSNSSEGDHAKHNPNEAMFEPKINEMIKMIMISERLIYDDMNSEADTPLYDGACVSRFSIFCNWLLVQDSRLETVELVSFRFRTGLASRSNSLVSLVTGQSLVQDWLADLVHWFVSGSDSADLVYGQFQDRTGYSLVSSSRLASCPGLSLVQIQDWTGLVTGLWLVSVQDWLLVSFLVLVTGQCRFWSLVSFLVLDWLVSLWFSWLAGSGLVG
ncbi:hypothetical protein L7F22_023027 [Adiantum nelumboides]|nr:hypothetical protein [Adiantum nelumboides]